MKEDALGEALLDYYSGELNEKIIVRSDISEDDFIPVHYLFRAINQLPDLEKKALSLCRGKVLDVGAGSGCHSLILKEKGLMVDAIDVSLGAVTVMKERGINAFQIDFFNYVSKYDTLLFLMNGVGVAGNLQGLNLFLEKCKTLLAPGGCVLLDSSDISYMFKDEDGALWTDLNKPYYGEVSYQMAYKEYTTKDFNWLFVDFETLKLKALALGFNVELVFEDDNNQYLTKLSL